MMSSGETLELDLPRVAERDISTARRELLE
jgi:hypothetical protein